MNMNVNSGNNKVFVENGGYHKWQAFNMLITEYYLEHKKPCAGVYFFETNANKTVVLFYDVLYGHNQGEPKPIKLRLSGKDPEVGEVEKIILKELDDNTELVEHRS
jgi:hypothetical protein